MAAKTETITPDRRDRMRLRFEELLTEIVSGHSELAACQHPKEALIVLARGEAAHVVRNLIEGMPEIEKWEAV